MLAAVCALAGAALVTGSVATSMLIVVRLLHGFGLGMLVGLVPLYLAETAPPRYRGFLLCINTACISMGYFVYVNHCYPSSMKFADTASWGNLAVLGYPWERTMLLMRQFNGECPWLLPVSALWRC